jgi:hypothetical protein
VDGLRFNSEQEQKIFLFSKMARLGLGSTWSPDEYTFAEGEEEVARVWI